MNFLAIQVSFLRGQAVYVTTHFLTSRILLLGAVLFIEVACYLRKLFIIIFRNPLLVATFRLMEISLLPANISTSIEMTILSD